MTAPLHHINQLILHLPVMGSVVAGQAGVEEELRRQARLAEANNIHRDLVEIVSETYKIEALEPLRPETDKRRRKPRQPIRSRESGDVFDPVEAVVDFKV
jgi:hypothetical protein